MKRKYEGDGPGIYEIFCHANQKRYIGQAVRVVERLLVHFQMLKNASHTNNHLQSAYDLYGSSQFECRLYEACAIESLHERERQVIAGFGLETLFNQTGGGEGFFGVKHSEYSKNKNSKTAANNWDSGFYNDPKMEVRRINVFTGTRTSYARAGLAEADGFAKNAIMSCLCGSKRTHKGFFWQRGDDQTIYEQLLATLPKPNLQQAKTFRTFALMLDGFPVEDEPAPVMAPKVYKVKPPTLTNKSRTYKPVERIDVLTGLVKEYDSISAAVRDGFDRSTLQRALKGKFASYRGFYWQPLETTNQTATTAHSTTKPAFLV